MSFTLSPINIIHQFARESIRLINTLNRRCLFFLPKFQNSLTSDNNRQGIRRMKERKKTQHILTDFKNATIG